VSLTATVTEHRFNIKVSCTLGLRSDLPQRVTRPVLLRNSWRGFVYSKPMTTLWGGRGSGVGSGASCWRAGVQSGPLGQVAPSLRLSVHICDRDTGKTLTS
jgi:hypothetical protein